MPIREGWSVIGHTDKYLSPAAVELVFAKKVEFVIRVAEAGPVAIWHNDTLRRMDLPEGLVKMDTELYSGIS